MSEIPFDVCEGIGAGGGRGADDELTIWAFELDVPVMDHGPAMGLSVSNDPLE